MDKTEVTNRDYRACVDDKYCDENAKVFGEDYFRKLDYPIVGVNFVQAGRYCQWLGKRLPTVEEWRAAVSLDGRIYPWGNTIPSCREAVINGCTPGRPDVVGSKPEGQSRDGILDLIGNVWEWTSTPGSGKEGIFVTVGGSWSNPDNSPQGGFEAFNPPNAPAQGMWSQTSNIGFRCVADQAPPNN